MGDPKTWYKLTKLRKAHVAQGLHNEIRYLCVDVVLPENIVDELVISADSGINERGTTMPCIVLSCATVHQALLTTFVRVVAFETISQYRLSMHLTCMHLQV